jgi:uncharacterized protein YdaU (DUF1376 family)
MKPIDSLVGGLVPISQRKMSVAVGHATLPWLALYPNDFVGWTQRMTTLEAGACTLLAMALWGAKSLPDDDSQLATITKLSKKSWLRLRPKVEQYFNICDGRWTCAWIDKARQDSVKRLEKWESASEHGRVAALAKHRKSALGGVAEAIAAAGNRFQMRE